MSLVPHLNPASQTYVAVSGGVGGAKMALGLSKILDPSELSIITNTGDDLEYAGLQICPDIDTVLYTLAGINNTETGWGRADETWSFMAELERSGGETWFKLGDKDVALHVERTKHLRHGERLTRVTLKLASDLGVKHPVLPMSDQPVRTIVETDKGALPFQHYFVKEQCRPKAMGFCFKHAEKGRPSPEAIKALDAVSLGGILICPSNPFVSIDPVLSVPGMRQAMKASGAPIVAVSPIVGGKALKGPAAKMMRELGVPSTAVSVAEHYRGFIDALVIDTADESHRFAIEAIGIRTLVTRTVMISLEDRIALAQAAVSLAQELALQQNEGANL